MTVRISIVRMRHAPMRVAVACHRGPMRMDTICMDMKGTPMIM